MSDPLPHSEVVLYQSEDGSICVENELAETATIKSYLIVRTKRSRDLNRDDEPTSKDCLQVRHEATVPILETLT